MYGGDVHAAYYMCFVMSLLSHVLLSLCINMCLRAVLWLCSKANDKK